MLKSTLRDPGTELARILSEMTVDGSEMDPIDKAVRLARRVQQRGSALQQPQEKHQQRELERMLANPEDKATLIQMTDQAFRSKPAARAADQLIHILDVQGVPRFFSLFERAMLKGFQSFAGYLPGIAVPPVKQRMRAETANVILPAEAKHLIKHLQRRREDGVRMNVNYLGEALLGEEQAQRRVDAYLAALQLEQIECISVKISTIYSQISSLARERSLRILCERLELLYRAAAKAKFKRADGSLQSKFVYLDMEAYGDLSITVDAFMATLDRAGLEQVSAGIALQAYLPDSYLAQQQINAWARRRVANGGAPVGIRIVKGANREMERVDASLAGWPMATYQVKAETDANFKRMLHQGLEADNIAAVRLGVASHNLFDVCYALVLGHERGLLDHIQFEMLEGMANHQCRALCELTDNLLLYAPATKQEDFVNAIGYLIRRLDENTGPENFLRHAFKLEVDSDEWQRLEQGFRDSFALIGNLQSTPRRTQDRNRPVADQPRGPMTLAEFNNEPDTDFALPANLRWVQQLVEQWKPRCNDSAIDIPLVIAGEEIRSGHELLDCRDPSRPNVVVARYRQADGADLKRAIDCAVRDPKGWRDMPENERDEILARVAHELRRARGELIGAALADTGKLISESDPEVSEAIDFAELYPASARALRALPGVDASPKGVVAVVPPWNFPIAIPCGGVCAALAAGNSVLLKPASHSVLVGYQLARCFWRAGVPKEVVQFVPCTGATGGAELVASPEVDLVILTGGTDTALRMLDVRPDLQLLAETGGKNATIVTAMSDREQAIKHVLHSAFSHGGQKCSATSLLVLEAELYDDPAFKQMLCDAVRSIRVGSAWDLNTRLGPLIQPPAGDLDRAFKELEVGESWALMPRQQDDNPALYSPGIKWGVSPGSYTHRTEFFGPLLAVMRAENLEQAMDMVNQTGYGLTSGLESLDDREQARWQDGIRAGNLYINRVTTGAVVLRQPFGGMGKSAFGPGIKAGGPNYVAQLMNFVDRAHAPSADGEPLANADLEMLRQRLLALRELPSDAQRVQSQSAKQPGSRHSGYEDIGADSAELERLCRAMASYAANYNTEFGKSHDHFQLVGQDNLRRYLPIPKLCIRVDVADSLFEIFARVCAARTVGCHIRISTPPDSALPAVRLLGQLTEPWANAIDYVEESDQRLADVVRKRQTDRLRYASRERVPTIVRRAIGDSGIYIADAPVLVEGRIELLWYVREQSISYDYHRYGNLAGRADEPRRAVL
jgi:RHH-type proline utilization regulon transcriptional repressor/proline dehydrogenase/delta 1-pyrroline-5-carboxylate dehydrogenase